MNNALADTGDVRRELEELEAESVGWSPSPRLRHLDSFMSWVMTGLFLANLVLVVVATFKRYLLHSGLADSVEISKLLLGGLVFLGSAIAFNQGEHRSLRLFVDMLPERLRSCADAFVIGVVGAFAVVMLRASWSWLRGAEGIIIGTDFPAWIEAVPLVAGMALLIVYCAALLADKGLVACLGGLVGVVAVGVVMLLSQQMYPDITALEPAFTFYLVVLLVLLLGGVPIGFCFGIVVVGLLFSAGDTITIEGVARRTTSSSTEFILTAVPFFVFAGLLMERGGSTRRIIEVAKSWIGHIRGGLGHVTVGSMYFMSGVTGSEAADVAAVGTFMRRPLREQGWSGGEATGILVASSVMGASVPPSIGLVVLGAASSLSVGSLFVAGFLPAAFLALVLLLAVYVRARMKGMQPDPRATWGERLLAIRGALFALGIPVLIVGGMVFGVGTPTELAAVAAAYVLIVEVAIERSVGWRDLVDVATKTAVMSGMILFIVATASGLVYVSTYALIPQSFGESVLEMAGGSKYAFLFLTVLALIPLGMLMEGLPALLIFPSVFLPFATQIGVDPIHYGILMFIAVYIGANLPPLGAGYFFAAAVMKTPLQKGFGPALGYLSIVVVGLCLLILFPAITTLLPDLIGAGGSESP